MLIRRSTLQMTEEPFEIDLFTAIAVNNARAAVDTSILSGTATYDPANLADGAGVTTNVTVTGAALGDEVEAVSFSNDVQGMTISAEVSAANTVAVRFQNESGGALDLASGTIRARVRHFKAPMVDNSTGTGGSAVVAVSTQNAKVALSGTNLASRTAFNTAIGKVNNAVNVLSTYLNANAWATLGLAAPTGFDGTVALAGTVAALDLTVGGGIDGSAGNSMLRSEFNAAVVRQRNNYSAVLKMYNSLAVALGVATLADASGGSSNGISYNGSANVTAATAIAAPAVAASDLATKAAADLALSKLANNIATLVAKINSVLLSATTTAAPLPIVLVP